MTRLRTADGMSIIEMTVMLSVLFILAGVMSPIVSESVTTARAVKAKNDASMIATGLINLLKDIGGDALSFGGVAEAGGPLALRAAAGPGRSRTPDVLATEGDQPETQDPADAAAAGGPSLLRLIRPAMGNGREDGAGGPDVERRRQWLERVDSLDAHLRSNQRGYRFRRPGEYGGWNGPYVSAPVKGDPWGRQYMVNTRWLSGGGSAADSEGRPRRAVFVVSPGNNGVIETPFDQSIADARAYGDDIVIRIQ